MKSNYQKQIDELAEIMNTLADVWPGDREDIMVAGARLEDTMEGFDQSNSQIRDLLSLAWKGLIHLYKKDDYFHSVKSATMQGINTLREYALSNGDIPIEQFEKSCKELEKSLNGGNETVASMSDTPASSAPLDTDRPAAPAGEDQREGKRHPDNSSADDQPEQATEETGTAVDGVARATFTLDDLAALIMSLDSVESIEQQSLKLKEMLESVLAEMDDKLKNPLREALDILMSNKAADSQGNDPLDWEQVVTAVSERVEEAITLQLQEDAEPSAAASPDREKTDKKEHSSSKQGSADEKAAGSQKQRITRKKDLDLKKQEKAGKKEPDSQQQDHSGETPEFYIPGDADQDLIGEYITESIEQIEVAESALLDLESIPGDKELINTIFRSFHTIKGTSAFMGLTPISEFAHSVETLLDMVRDDVIPYDSACADITLEAIDVLKILLEGVEKAGNGERLEIPAGYDKLMKVLVNISECGKEPSKALEQSPDTGDLQQQNTSSGAKAGATGSPTGKTETESTVRLNVNRLDRLIDMVGELVIAHSVVAQDGAIQANPELSRKMAHSTKILRELQDTSLTLRMVPLKATFNKMNRLVRDLGKKGGKTVRLTTHGEDTEIDRNMVDIINEPLVHLLRNAIDHGIESPESRTKSGKPGIATIGLHAFQAGGKVVIEIQDDGRGMNREKILKKAIAKGLVEPNKKMTDSEIYKLIFLPGFSTAEQVTDLSGRGVGMDVVRRSIEKLQGKVNVASEPGKGTTISLELPFTLAITDGMLIRIGEQRFIVPTINIDMTFRAEERDLFTVMGTDEQVMFRGDSIPVIRLHKLFSIKNGIESIIDGTLLVINNNKKKYALLVDEVIGQQQLVGKSINMPVKMKNISGGAILGDGQVGLILDMMSLLN